MSDESQKVSLVTEVDYKTLAATLAEEGYESGWETLIDFVKKLDQEVGDWEFTLALHKYFKGEKKDLRAWEKEQQESRAARLANGTATFTDRYADRIKSVRRT